MLSHDSIMTLGKLTTQVLCMFSLWFWSLHGARNHETQVMFCFMILDFMVHDFRLSQ